MARIVRTPLVAEDLLTIWSNIAQDDPAAADRMLLRFDEVIHTLADNPLLGESQDQLRSGLRRFVVGAYPIFYLPMDDGVTVISILHGARRYEDLL